MSEKAKIIIRGEETELPIVEGTEKEIGVDISSLRGSTGAVTLDYGFKNTGSTTSSITYLDGEQGIFHRHHGSEHSRHPPDSAQFRVSGRRCKGTT